MINDNFKSILEALVNDGFQSLTDKKEQQGKPLDFKITPYSLNTPLSFKFDSVDHFLEFLRMHDDTDMEKKATVLQTTFIDLALNPNEFFYVNFFEKGKAQEI